MWFILVTDREEGRRLMLSHLDPEAGLFLSLLQVTLYVTIT